MDYAELAARLNELEDRRVKLVARLREVKLSTPSSVVRAIKNELWDVEDELARLRARL